MSKKKKIESEVVIFYASRFRFGTSKYEERIRLGRWSTGYIFSRETGHKYIYHAKQFCKWLKEYHPVRTYKHAKVYVNEYLEYLRREKNYSPYTLALVGCALGFLYRCKSTDFGFVFPKRERKLIKRSRDVSLKEVLESDDPRIHFLIGSGLRRHEARMILGREIYRNSNGELIAYVRKGKGGKTREVVILPEYADEIERMAAAVGSDELIIGKFPSSIPAHFCRAVYAHEYYRLVARDLSTLDKKETYRMRGDMKGKVFDRQAMLEVSRQLGHNRVSVIAGHYLYDFKP